MNLELLELVFRIMLYKLNNECVPFQYEYDQSNGMFPYVLWHKRFKSNVIGNDKKSYKDTECAK